MKAHILPGAQKNKIMEIINKNVVDFYLGQSAQGSDPTLVLDQALREAEYQSRLNEEPIEETFDQTVSQIRKLDDALDDITSLFR